MIRKTTTSPRTQVDSPEPHRQHRARTWGKDVVIPLVLWNEPPQVEVSTLHVLELPLSQPSQNSAPFSAPEDRNANETCTQLCVFAGTMDGLVLYWRLNGDSVAQVNLLLFPARGESPVVGLTSGIDEWGQSMVVSATQDGALAKWQLPNGACAAAQATLAKEVAPLVGLEMVANKRFAIVASKVSRLVVLDTWRMERWFCMDTAQEQIRHSVAVGELWPAHGEQARPPLRRSHSGSTIEAAVGLSHDVKSRRPSSPRTSIPSGPVGTRLMVPTFSPHRVVDQSTPRWDALVLSLGTEGLVKCFLWTQPHSAHGGAPIHATHFSGKPHCGVTWVQRSSWVVSWADQADDITCSQSTSLKDGDNMNPQTALMGSIKSSYFPRAVHVSSDSSRVLFMWKTKFVILKRKWLCPIETRSSRQHKLRAKSAVGSCCIAPSEFVRQAATFYGNTWPLAASSIDAHGTAVGWQNGVFRDDGSVMMWTDSGHVFQFPAAHVTDVSTGKLFLFTKDPDQLVPRSDSKALRVIDKAEFVTCIDHCQCCDRTIDTKSNQWMALGTKRPWHPGYTSCVRTRASESESVLKVVHVCYRGKLGSWTMSAEMASPAHKMSSLSNIIAPRVFVAERVQFHTLMDGFQAVSSAVKKAKGEEEEAHASSLHRECLTHLILGRDDAYSSSTYKVGSRAGRRRQRQHPLNDERINSLGSITSLTSSAAAVVASNVSVLATALAPATSRSAVQEDRAEYRLLGVNASADQVAVIPHRYLLDIPVIAKGFSDGMLYLGFLSQAFSPKTGTNPGTHLKCHSGRITALAHCFWELKATSSSSSVPFSPGRVSMDESCFATKQNRFYRSRFYDVAISQTIEDRQAISSNDEGHCSNFIASDTLSGLDVKVERSHDALASSQPSLKLFVFSGGTDGVFRVIDLCLLRSSGAINGINQKVKIVHGFRNHRGAIEQISISPLQKGNDRANGPDRWAATVGTDRKVVLYAPQYSKHPVHDQFHGRSCGRVRWECVFELAEHGDRVCSLEWHLERGLLFIECADRMVYVWSLDSGILERTIPSALLYAGGNASTKASIAVASSRVDHSTLSIGHTAVQLIEFAVLQSAELLKQNWTSYYASLFQSKSTSGLNPNELPSLYATGSIELWMMSLLLSWGVTPAIDKSCQTILGIQPTHALYSCALHDVVSGALTIPLPWITLSTPERKHSVVPAPPFARNWQHSSALSASMALGVVSFCMSCMEYKHSRSDHGSTSPANKEEFKVLWSQLITQHSIVLPESVAEFREPALEELATFGFDSCEYTQLAARTLLRGIIQRLPAIEKSSLSAEYSAKLHWEIIRLETETGSSFLGTVSSVGSSGPPSSTQLNGTCTSSESTGGAHSDAQISFSLVVDRLGSLVLLMSMIGTYFPGEISPASAREVCDVLVYLLKAPDRFVASVSAELLTKGLMLFRPHLVDLSSLVVQLLLIDMREKQRHHRDEKEQGASSPGDSLADFNDGGAGGSHAAMSFLVEVGAYESAFVLGLLQQEMHTYDRPAGFHESILLYMMELIASHYLLLCRHLPAFVDTIMACLEPTKPERRRRCLPLCTRCLHSLVRRFPMVDFHQETQRLALGTMEAVIVIYDLRTATKWRVLDGHGSAISAVRFRVDGQVLVSYAARDSSVRWWNSGNAGLFGGMLKMHQSCLKEHKLAALQENANGRAPSSTGGTSAGLKQIIQTCCFQYLARKDSSDSSRKVENPKHVLRLTREDASQVQFLL